MYPNVGIKAFQMQVASWPTMISKKSLKEIIKFNLSQFSSVAQSCPTLCDPMNRSMPGLPTHHQLPELTQTHVHQVGDVIQWSHPLSSPSPHAFNLSQHQGLFFTSGGQSFGVSAQHQFSKEYSGLTSFRIDWLDLLAVQGTLKSLL